MGDIVVEEIRIELSRHVGSDLMIAHSHELRGLMVPGRSLEEIDRKIVPAIRELLEARGLSVVSIDIIERDASPSEFLPGFFCATARTRRPQA